MLCTITSLKNNHSTGYDGISNKIIKLCGKYISKPLAYIYIYIYIYTHNECLTAGLFLDRMKCARIIPLFKNGDRSFILNYRLISLLTGFAKSLKF